MPNRGDILAVLAPKEKWLFCQLYGKRGQRPERDIDELFKELCVGTAEARDDPSYRQMRVGSIVSRTNAKLGSFGLRIVPGEARRSYRIVTSL